MSDRGPWFLTSTGKEFYPMDPRPEDICIKDIAHALANMCRYGGHCREFYSVAQHSVLVSRFVADEYAQLGLMHDAGEAYLLDIVRPIKALFPAAVEMEARIMDCIIQRFPLECTPEAKAAGKEIDNRMLVTEARSLMPRSGYDWEQWGEPLSIPDISPFSPTNAKIQFLDTFEHLFNDD